jgi:CRISPR/Cas system CSM-associated protein Csm2 small subunit
MKKSQLKQLIKEVINQSLNEDKFFIINYEKPKGGYYETFYINAEDSDDALNKVAAKLGHVNFYIKQARLNDVEMEGLRDTIKELIDKMSDENLRGLLKHIKSNKL